jgi:DNA replication protein DnaC
MRSKRSLRQQLSEVESRPTRSSRTTKPSYTIPDSDEDEREERPSRRSTRSQDSLPKSSPEASFSFEQKNFSGRNTRNSREVRDSLSNVGSSGKRIKKRQDQMESDQEENLESIPKKFPRKKEKSPSQSDEDDQQGKKYSFRDRERHHRTQLNVAHLGGDGQSYEPLDLASDSQSDINESNDEKLKSNSNRDDGVGDEDQEEEEEDDDEEDENDSPRRKYSFRDRSRHRRETLNVTHLGGEGQSYLKKKPHNGSNSSARFTYRDTTRMYLGGRLPNYKTEGSHHPSHKRRLERRAHYDSSSESSSNSSCQQDRKRHRNTQEKSPHEEEVHFREHEEERLRKEMASIVPLTLNQMGNNNLSSGMGGSVRDQYSKKDLSRADVNPLAVDSSIGFASVGGLDNHISALKEMVVLPLLYPEVFQRFDTQPPRGVLFVGPPGTGKTLTARALANSLSTAGGANSGVIGGKKVSFFMRKGADCLSKWVGEGERQLRLLFEQVFATLMYIPIKLNQGKTLSTFNYFF